MGTQTTCPFTESGVPQTGEMVELLRPLCSTPKPLQLSFSSSHPMSLVDYLEGFDIFGFQLLDTLKEVGVKAKVSIGDVQTIMISLCEHHDRDMLFERFMKQIVSREYAFLPTRDELAPHAADLLEPISSNLPASLVKVFTSALGITKLDPFIVLSGRLARSPFLTEQADAFLELNILNASDLTALDEEGHSLFSSVRTVEAFEWLVSKMPREDALRLLRLRPPPP
eukprot:TRINITY_DN2857_c0_g1_i2.p1 TRINITY_DN2857_c0_g1~~TRINITY_DN2857_c0_g1_i2.p1  ORF type:complete len:226 (+),score=29.25 TRINITY_DN2857_c0_g1_i2:468-1145(+)